jgi:hypothetical protein
MGCLRYLIYICCSKTYNKVYELESETTEYITVDEFEQIFKEQSRMVDVYL